jgi:hypothetical protein
MNAPPGFLEFLLCIPWHQLQQLHPASLTATTAPAEGAQQAAADGSGSGAGQQQQQREQQQQQQQEQQQQQRRRRLEQLVSQGAADAAERQLLVNQPLHPQLLQSLLQFLYRPQYINSVPPILRPQPHNHHHQHSDGVQPVCAACAHAARNTAAACMTDAQLREAAAAALDGATPLHCAALLGNPAQVHHLLRCGADPTMRNAAGESPLQLVPACGAWDRAAHRRVCLCLRPAAQEVWECRSRMARTLISRACLPRLRMGILRYLSMLWLWLLLLLGLAKSANTLER